MRQVALAACCVLIGTGCEPKADDSHGGDRAFFDHADLHPVFLVGQRLNASPAIAQPTTLALAGDVLWVRDAATDPALHAIDIRTGELLLSVGRRGEGPGEFSTAPSTIGVRPGDTSAVWAFDLRLQRLTRFEPRPLSEHEPSIVRLNGVPRIWRYVWVRRDRFIGAANSQDARFSVFSATGKREASVPGPLLGPADAPLAERLKATNAGAQLCSWPGRGFVVVNNDVGRLEFYDQDAHLVRLARIPFAEDALFRDSLGTKKFVWRRQWYLHCTATSDYLYASFSGRVVAAYEDEERSSGEFVHVFDWLGDLRAVYRLDRSIRPIVVDASGSRMYAASLVEAAIYAYDLPPVAGVAAVGPK